MRKGALDFAILTVTVLLTLFGLVMVFSASYYIAQQSKDTQGTFFLTKQLIGAAVGLITLFIASYIPYKFYNKAIIPGALMAVSIVLLIIVLFMAEKNAVHRFISIAGQSFQPSEIGRVSIVFFIAWWVSRHGEEIRSKNFKVFLKGISGPMFATIIIGGLILAGSNLSMAGSTLLIALVMLLVAGVGWKPFVLMLTGGVGLGALFAIVEPYRFARLLVFTDPWKYPQTGGYQLVQSLYALGNGGLFGVGLGNSRQKLLYLPYAESDFILSIIGEELGFLGMCALVLAFWVLIWRGMLVAAKAPDEFGMMLACGLTSLVGIQFLINVLVVTSTIPPTGVPLPFISAGNSSLIVFMTAMGVLLNVSKNAVKT